MLAGILFILLGILLFFLWRANHKNKEVVKVLKNINKNYYYAGGVFLFSFLILLVITNLSDIYKKVEVTQAPEHGEGDVLPKEFYETPEIISQLPAPLNNLSTFMVLLCVVAFTARNIWRRSYV